MPSSFCRYTPSQPLDAHRVLLKEITPDNYASQERSDLQNHNLLESHGVIQIYNKEGRQPTINQDFCASMAFAGRA
jgi:hypothetical protein